MKCAKHITTALLLLTAAAALLYLCDIGYGYGRIVMSTQENIAHKHKVFKPEQLAVTYQRTYDNHTDFLHFKVDTTYHKIGRNNFVYEHICNRKFSLTASETAHNNLTDYIAEFFIAGGSRKWYPNNLQREILGESCLYAVSTEDNSVWESWYCEALPHVQAGARPTDGLEGLILEVRNIEKQYTLKAVNISKTI